MLRAVIVAAAGYAAFRIWERIRAENAAPPKLLAPPDGSRQAELNEALAPIGMKAS